MRRTYETPERTDIETRLVRIERAIAQLSLGQGNDGTLAELQELVAEYEQWLRASGGQTREHRSMKGNHGHSR